MRQLQLEYLEWKGVLVIREASHPIKPNRQGSICSKLDQSFCNVLYVSFEGHRARIVSPFRRQIYTSFETTTVRDASLYLPPTHCHCLLPFGPCHRQFTVRNSSLASSFRGRRHLQTLHWSARHGCWSFVARVAQRISVAAHRADGDVTERWRGLNQPCRSGWTERAKPNGAR